MSSSTVIIPQRRGSSRVTFLVLAVGVGAYGLLQSLVTPVLRILEQALGTSQSNVTWVLTSYLISASIFTPIVGRLGDLTGKKRMFVMALVALAFGCLISALATNLAVMLVGRVVQGIGGGVLPLSFGIIREEFAPEKVSSAVGAISALVAVGAGAGTVLAGPIVDSIGYHWLFWLPLVALVGAAAAAAAFVPESGSRSPAQVNWWAAVLLSGWLVALLVPISQASSWGWTSARVLGLLATAVVLAVLWVAVEIRSAHPLIDMHMMRIRAVWTTNLVGLLFGFAMYASFAFFPEFLQTPTSAGYGFGASITGSGLFLLPQTATMFVFGLLAGPLAARVGSRAVLLAGTVVGVAGYLTFALSHHTEWAIYLIAGVMGIGFGLAYAAMSSLIVAAVPAEQTGVASGMNANVRTIGGAVGAAVMASVVTSGVAVGAVPADSGYTHGYLLLTGGLALSALATLLIPRAPRLTRLRREPAVPLRHDRVDRMPAGTLVGGAAE